MPFGVQSGDEVDLNLTLGVNQIVAGSPFPYQSVTPTCP